MRRKFKTMILFMVIAAMVLSVAACASNSDKAAVTSEESEKTSSQSGAAASGSDASNPIVISVMAWNPCMFLNLAQDLGYFEKLGVNVKLQNFEEYTDVPSAFAAGHLDAAFYSSFDVLTPISTGSDMKVVSVLDKSNGVDAILGAKDYKSIKDLVGKKVGIGINTIEYFYFMHEAQQAGCSMKDFQFVDMNPSTLANAMIAGQVDGTAIFEPFISSIKKGTTVNVITDTSKNPNLITDCIVFSGKVLNKRHDDVVKIMQAYYQALDYYNKNTDKAAEMMAKNMGDTKENFIATMKKLDMLDSAASMDFLSGKDQKDSWVSHQTEMVSNLYDQKILKEKPDLNKAIDVSVVEEITKEIKK